MYIKSKQNDKFCPTSVKIVLDDGKDTKYNLFLPNGPYHNKGERDMDKYTADKSTNWKNNKKMKKVLWNENKVLPLDLPIPCGPSMIEYLETCG